MQKRGSFEVRLFQLQSQSTSGDICWNQFMNPATKFLVIAYSECKYSFVIVCTPLPHKWWNSAQLHPTRPLSGNSSNKGTIVVDYAITNEFGRAEFHPFFGVEFSSAKFIGGQNFTLFWSLTLCRKNASCAIRLLQ